MKAVREWLWINLCEQHDTYIKKTNSRSYLGWCDDYDATTPLSDEAKEVHASLMKCKDISDVYKWMQSHPKQDNDLWGKIEEHY